MFGFFEPREMLRSFAARGICCLKLVWNGFTHPGGNKTFETSRKRLMSSRGMFAYDSITVSSSWELTSVSMRYSHGEGVNTSLSRIMYYTHVVCSLVFGGRSFPVWCVWLSSVARPCATRDASNTYNLCKSTIPAGINCLPLSKLPAPIYDHGGSQSRDEIRLDGKYALYLCKSGESIQLFEEVKYGRLISKISKAKHE